MSVRGYVDFIFTCHECSAGPTCKLFPFEHDEARFQKHSCLCVKLCILRSDKVIQRSLFSRKDTKQQLYYVLLTIGYYYIGGLSNKQKKRSRFVFLPVTIRSMTGNRNKQIKQSNLMNTKCFEIGRRMRGTDLIFKHKSILVRH